MKRGNNTARNSIRYQTGSGSVAAKRTTESKPLRAPPRFTPDSDLPWEAGDGAWGQLENVGSPGWPRIRDQLPESRRNSIPTRRGARPVRTRARWFLERGWWEGGCAGSLQGCLKCKAHPHGPNGPRTKNQRAGGGRPRRHKGAQLSGLPALDLGCPPPTIYLRPPPALVLDPSQGRARRAAAGRAG